ncbi:MAG TPA: hypothetical protein VFB79_22535 [Candidatus Angelobacter sp.]|nr:hypothetical protein [Candidatus Angelobacter sp.]
MAASGVRYKFDTATAVRDTWSAGDQLLVKSLLDRDFLKHMVGARNMKIEFTPLGKEPQIASFDMGNFKQLVENEKGCNFVKKAWAF